MDEPDAPRPTASELGISDAEYARILRGLPQRDAVPAPPAEGGVGPRWWSVASCLALAGVVVAALLALGGEDADDDAPAYAFMQVDGDQPVTYTSCRQIQVAVYPAGGPPDAEELVREAVGRMRSATGLDIVVTGAFGGHAPNWNFEAGPVHPDDPISVSWQDGDAIAELTDHTAGLGGSRVTVNPDGSLRRVAGTIALSRDYYEYLAEEDDHAQALAVLLHEFGHVLGLDHVGSPRELMYERNIGQTGFGPGDLEGLRRLGRGPCV